MRSAPYATELGDGWIVHDGGRIVRLVLPGIPPGAPADPEPPQVVIELAGRLSDYFAGGPLEPDDALIAMAARTDLDEDIYRVVSAIPPGETLTYTEVASLVGRTGAARAVGAAMARNPFAPIIPCHRVVGSDGSLKGYPGGLDMKRLLLVQERADA